jgi:hypothetical protein
MKSESARCACGINFRKRRLAQRYCSPNCRKVAYERRVGRILTDLRHTRKREIAARESVGTGSEYADTGKRRKLRKKANENNSFQSPISASSLFPSCSVVPIDILGGKSGSNGLSRALSEAIVSREVG